MAKAYLLIVWFVIIGTLSGCTDGKDEAGHFASSVTTGQQQLDLSVFIRNEAPWETNGFKPRLYIKNNSSVALANFEVHSFFTVAPGKTPVLDDLYTPRSVPRIEQVDGPLWRVVYDFAGYTLMPGATSDPNTPPSGNVVHLHYSDWSPWIASDDWSYAGVNGSFAPTDTTVVVDQDGDVVHGVGPDGVYEPAPPAPSNRHWFTVTFPLGLSVSEFGLVANGALQLGTGAKVFLGTGGAVAPIANTGHGSTTIGAEATAGSVFGKGLTQIGAAVVGGDVISAGALVLDPQAVVTGEVFPPFTPFPIQHRAFFVDFPIQSIALPDIPPGQTHSFAPGSYGTLVAGAGETFELNQAGTYFFDSVSLAPGSTLRLKNATGPIYIYVDGSLSVRGALVRTDPNRFNVQWGYVGKSAAIIGSAFRGTLLAPRATIQLAALPSGQSHKGAFFGRSVDVAPNAVVYHHALAIDCPNANDECRPNAACPLVDSDDDLIPDCVESQDGEFWTNPDEANGALARWDDQCTFQAGQICSAIDDVAEVDACTSGSPQEEQRLTSGWHWSSVSSSNLCNPEYGFVPPWTECSNDWTLNVEAQLYIGTMGTYCFSVVSSTPDACGAVFFDSATTGITSQDDAECFDLSPGVYPIRWFRAAAPGTTGDFSVNFCSGGDEPCTPSDPIPTELLRPDGCGEDECSTICRCGPGGPCHDASVCAQGLSCVSGIGDKFNRPGSDVCADDDCPANPGATGCFEAPLDCNVDADCPAGEACDTVGERFGYPGIGGTCIDLAVCNGPDADLFCGSIDSRCGFCGCFAECSQKVCGDDAADGCGGLCSGYCATGQSGCSADYECEAGSICRDGSCVHSICETPDCDTTLCGGICGECVPECGGAECGTDSKCGASCGTCEGAAQCVNGMCVRSDSDRPEIPDHPGTDPVTSPIGTMAGEFAVSRVGRASYQVPIELPSGRGGVRPSIALLYSGTPSAGNAGVGWELKATSRITRCNKTVALDGWPGRVKGDESDAFCLDGQRLVLISGTAGISGAKYRTETETFSDVTYFGDADGGHWVVRTKDGRTARYGTEFRSWMVNRETEGHLPWAWYVADIANRAGVSIHHTYECPGEWSRWGGGYFCRSEPRLVSIEYGAHPGGASPTAGASLHRVSFSYEERDHEHIGYGSAYLASQLLAERLSGIKVWHGGEAIRHYRLNYGQNGSGRGDFLTSLEECVNTASGEVCLSPTVFEYADGADLFQDPVMREYFVWTQVPLPLFPETLFGGPVNKTAAERKEARAFGATPLLDFDGDGLLDFMSGRALVRGLGNAQIFDYSGPNLSQELECVSPGSLADFNLDGRTDLVEACPRDDGSIRLWVSTGVGGEFAPLDVQADEPKGALLFPMDINDDGLSDIISCRPDGYGLNAWIQGFDGLQITSTRVDLPPVPHGLWSCNWQVDPISERTRAYTLALDADADGAPNWMLRVGDNVYALVAERTSAGLDFRWEDVGVRAAATAPRGMLGGPLRLMDVNGDGMQDVLEHAAWLTDAANKQRIRLDSANPDQLDVFSTVWLNRGAYNFKSMPAHLPAVENGSLEVPPGQTEQAGVSARLFEIARVVDIDRDGLDELVVLATNGTQRTWYKLDPTTTDPSKTNAIAFEATPLDGLPTDERWVEDGSAPVFSDFDGDGAIDALFFENSTFLLYRGAQPERGLLKSVVDGLGNRVDVEYDASGANYTAASQCDANARCMPRVGPVVSKFSTTDANGSLEGFTTFAYVDGRVARDGWGPLGFRSRTAVDHTPDGEVLRTVTEEFDNGQSYDAATKRYPFAGKLLRSTTVTAPIPSGVPDGIGSIVDTPFKTVVHYTYAEMLSDAQRPFVVPKTVITQEFQIVDGDEKPLRFGSIRYHDDDVLLYDQYGNNWRYELTSSGPVAGSEQIRVENYYYPPGQRNPEVPPDSSLWEVGLLWSRIERSRGDSRRTDFEYEVDTGLLAVSIRDPDGDRRQTTLERDEFGNVTMVLEESATETKQTLVTYDENKLRPTSHVGPTGFETLVDLDPGTGRLMTELSPNGSATQHVYDAFGRKTKAIAPTGTVTMALSTSDEEHALFSVTTTTSDGTGASATTTSRAAHYDSRGRLRVQYSTGLDGVTLKQASYYDSQGFLSSEGLPHPVERHFPPGYVRYQRDILGNIRSIHTPSDTGDLDRVELFYYATRYTLREALMPGPLPERSRTVFAAMKREESSVGTRISMSFAGELQQPLMRRLGEGADTEEVRLAYGSFGAVTTYYGPNNTLNIERDDWGRVTAVSDSDLGRTDYSYDAFDRLERMIDADGGTTSYQYDSLDRLIRMTDPSGDVRFVFDRDLEGEAEGEPPTQNSLGQLVRASRQTARGTVTQTFRYEDHVANPLENRGLLERVRLETPSERFESSYEYVDGSSRINVLHYPTSDATDPFSVRYCYDATGSVTHVFDAFDGASCADPDAGQPPFWQRTRVKDGIAVDQFELGNGVTTTLDLDPATYRLVGLSVADVGSTSITFGYDYDRDGKLEQQTRAGSLAHTRDFGYKSSGVLDSLIEPGGSSYEPEYTDGLQLRTAPSALGTFVYEGEDGGNSPLSNRIHRLDPLPTDPNQEPTLFSYDARGNQDLREGPAVAGGYQSIEYNAFNLPDLITTGTGPDEFTVEFDYTASAQRVHTVRPTRETWHFGDMYEKDVPFGDPDVAEEHRYWIAAGSQRIAEVVRSQSAVDGQWSESIRYLHYDRLGSVVGTSLSDGIIQEEYDYEVYGEPKQPLSTTFGYTGHRHEQDLGLIDAKGRFYDAKLGFFLSADPVTALGGGSPRMNRYAYVGYDPVNFIDPTGMIRDSKIASALVFGGDAGMALFLPSMNYMSTGEFSYDYTKESWEGLATTSAAVIAGVACAALVGGTTATGVGAPAGAVIGAFCAGLIGGALSAYFNEGDASDIARSAFQAAIMGAVSAGAGAYVGDTVSNGISNPYAIASIETTVTAGTNVVQQLLYSGDVDFGLVAIQTSLSGIQTFYRAVQDDASLRRAYGAEYDASMRETYSKASRAMERRLTPEELELLQELLKPPTGPDTRLACGPTCFMVDYMNPTQDAEFNAVYQQAVAIGSGAAVLGIVVPAWLAGVLGIEAAGGAAAVGSTLARAMPATQKELLRQLFRIGGEGGVVGASNALRAIRAGDLSVVPAGLTRETLLIYQRIAQIAPATQTGVQTIRLEIINELLKVIP